MPSSKLANQPGHLTKGDIFDDLGLSPQEALEAKIKSDLWRDLVSHIERKRLSQSHLRDVLKIHQPDVSNLLKGKISKFSTGKLIQFAVRLNLEVQVQLKEPRQTTRTVSSISAGRSSRKDREFSAGIANHHTIV
jgi:predicted XRE-type DNA-binding protein